MLNQAKIVEFFFLLTVFAIPAYLLKLSFWGLPTNFLEILAAISIFLALFIKKGEIFSSYLQKFKTFTIPLLLISIGLLTSFFHTPSLAGLGIIKSWFLIPFLFAFSSSLIFDDKEKINKLLKALYFSISLTSVVTLAYYYPGALTYDGRLSGFFLSPNHLAMYLSFGMFLIIYLLSEEEKPVLKNFLILSLFPLLIAFYFTFSYGAWLAVATSFFILILLRKLNSNSILIAMLLLSLLGIFLFLQLDKSKLTNISDSRSSLSSRFMIWKAAVKITADNPVVGIGPGNFQAYYLDYQQYFPPYLEWAVPQPHNLYLAFYLQAGFLGLLGFLLLSYKWLMASSKQKNINFMLISQGILIYILIHGLIDTPYWKNDLSLIFWVIFFSSMTLSQTQKKSHSSSL